MTLKDHHRAIALIIGGALLLQAGLTLAGFHRIDADESARSLMAWELSWANALEPWIWPPFYKIVVGLWLQAWPDLFLAPRVLAAAAGIALPLVLAALASALFRTPVTTVATVALAALLPDRLVFSTVPLSDIYYFLAMTGAALLLLRWLRDDAPAALLSGCLLVAVAQTVRYEALFIGLVIGAVLTWMWLAERRLAFGTWIAAGLLLGAFPLLWMVNSWLWYGSLDNLAITSQQFIGVHGRDYALALRELPLTQMARSLLVNPLLLLGLGLLLRCAWRDAALRRWALMLWLPLPVISAALLATLSITQVASWRQASLWILLLLPFQAQALVAIAERLRRFAWRGWAVAGLATLALLPMLARDLRIVDRGMMSWETMARRDERRIGLHLREALERLGGGRVLLDAQAQLDFLDVLTGSGIPERFVLTSDAPAQEVALAMPFTVGRPESRDPLKMARYQSDRFALAKGGEAKALRARDIRLILVRAPEFVAALDTSSLVAREEEFPGWTLYRLRSAPPPRVAGGAG